jgi:hypothetical protein
MCYLHLHGKVLYSEGHMILQNNENNLLDYMVSHYRDSDLHGYHHKDLKLHVN